MLGTLASSLEEAKPVPLVVDGVGRVNLVTASRLGDILALSRDDKSLPRLLYGFLGRDAPLLNVPSSFVCDPRNAEFNNSGDSVFILGSECLAVAKLPPRASDGGAATIVGADGDVLKSWSWTELVAVASGEPRLLEARWHAYADDHVCALDESGRLRLWSDGKCRATAVRASRSRTNAFKSFCWGASAGWARFSVFLLTDDDEIATACPLPPRRCAVPTSTAREMAEACRKHEWPSALEWLEQSVPLDVQEDSSSFVTFSSSNHFEAGVRSVATLGSSRERRALLVANTCRDATSSWTLLAVAYDDGLLELGLVSSAPTSFEDDARPGDGRKAPLAVLDSLLVSPAGVEPRGLWTETPAAALCYATNAGVVLIDVPWIEDDLERSLSAGRIADGDRASCRHIVALSDNESNFVVGVAIVASTDLLIWFEDGAAASVSTSAAAFYARLVDDGPVGATRKSSSALAPTDDGGMVARLADELRAQVDGARKALASVKANGAQKSSSSSADAEGVRFLAETRSKLETEVAVPLVDAGARAEALTKLLSMSREAQLQRLEKTVDRAKEASKQLDLLAELGAALADRAQSLATRANAVQRAATFLQPTLSKADKKYHADVRNLAKQADRNERLIADAANRVKGAVETSTPGGGGGVSLDDSHLALCHQLLQGQMTMLQQASTDIAQLQNVAVEASQRL